MSSSISIEDRNEIINKTLEMVRAEYTVMPRFGFHQPLDYYIDTFPPVFDPIVVREGVDLPLPGKKDRMGYSDNDELYLDSGRYDADLIRGFIAKHGTIDKPLHILDFGCSSGRVLRHFNNEATEKGWRLSGVDVQAHPIEWLRQHFPQHFQVFVGNTLPRLPFEDNSVDVIYGISVFTHIKYLWDNWLLELRRVLKPGGLLIQTIHTENAWNFYIANKDNPSFNNHSDVVLKSAGMDMDFFYHGDMSVSQVFWKTEVARKFWGRYLEVLEIAPPPAKYSFQDWVVARK